MFGILRPCQHRLSPALRTEWVAHLCGLCLTLRDQHGQLARAATNYDGIVVSALVEAQSDTESSRRVAGPCPLRGMRRASVAEGAGSSLAASVSLVLASAKVRDHADDGDGVLRHRSLATLARSAAGRWADRGGRTAALVRFDASVLTTAVESQAAVESALGPGDSVLAATEPTELATAAAFAHTAVLAGRPENAEPLHEVGRFFGRVAHLLDAVEDLDADRAAGVWNPLTATNTSLATARRLCDDAVRGVRWALRDVTLTRPALVHALLVHELRHAVRRTFGHASGRDGHGGHGGPGDHGDHGDHLPYDASGSVPPPPPFVGTDGDKGSVPPPAGPDGPTPPPHDHVFVNDGDGGCCWVPKFRVPPRRRNVVLGCGVATYMCCTCQFCCRDPWPGPWSGRPHDALVDCCDGCDCCNCCD